MGCPRLGEKTPLDRSSGAGWGRRRDSLSISFETGWTMPSSCAQDAGRVIRDRTLSRILVPARCAHDHRSAVSRPMSLYRAGLRFALFLPLGVAIPPAAFPPCGCRVRRCEPRYHSALSGRGDYLTNRTRVRKHYTVGTTCLVSSFALAPRPPTDRLQQNQSPCFNVSPK